LCDRSGSSKPPIVTKFKAIFCRNAQQLKPLDEVGFRGGNE